MNIASTASCSMSLIFAATVAGAQATDWSRAKSVDYVVVGEYKAETALVKSQRSAMADVTDRVVMRFRWDVQNARLVGAVAFDNFPSEVKNLHPDPKGCLQPVLKGPYEHFTLTSVADGLGGDLHMTFIRSMPETVVMAGCTGKTTVKARNDEEQDSLPIPSPELLALPVAAGPGQAISADRRSMVMREHGWTWTFTPTLGK